MDPASAVGLGVGVASLAFDAFDRSVKVFKFFSSMVDMPKDCERCRLQLMIEYNRLLAWGDAVGLIEVPDGSHIASTLGTHAVELCNIVAHIAWLLEEFKEINNRWKREMQTYEMDSPAISEEEAKRMDLSKQVSSLAAAYEKNGNKRKHLRDTHRMVRWMSARVENTKEIITNPLRVRWVMVDKKAFEVLLEDLHGLTERIHELMGDYRENRILEITAKTYREMVVVRNDLDELRDMLEAVTNLIEISTSTAAGKVTSNVDSHETLRDLLRLKRLKYISKEILLHTGSENELDVDGYLTDVITVSRYNGSSVFNSQFTHTAISDASTSKPYRPRGTLTQEGTDHEVWIEWKKADNVVDGSAEDKQSILRTATLA